MIQLQNRKWTAGGLILAGLAGLALYKYSKMSEEDKQNMMTGMRERGKKMYDQYVPENMKKRFGSHANSNMQADSRMGDGSDYTS